MAKEAERLLDGTGWLPEPLRPSEETPAGTSDTDAGGEEALPAFLADDEDSAGKSDTDEPAVIAAE
jgi:ParB family chromosome partitioning protein